MENNKLNFYCVQPISINKDNYIKLITNKDTNINEYQNYIDTENEMLWLKDNRYYNYGVYEKILNINLKLKIDNEELLPDIEKLKEKYDFIKDLDLNETKYNLLYDMKLKYFLLVIDISLILKNDVYIKEEHNDFYNDIRNLLVKETDDCQVSQWFNYVKSTILDYCLLIVKNIEYITFKENPFYISNNTGNITCFSNVKNQNFNEKLFLINDLSERKKKIGKPIEIMNEKYFFRGRFHTITINDNKSILRYFPIQFYIQCPGFSFNLLLKLIIK